MIGFLSAWISGEGVSGGNSLVFGSCSHSNIIYKGSRRGHARMMAKEASLRATKCYDARDVANVSTNLCICCLTSLVLGEGCGTAQNPNNLLYARRSVPG